MPTTAIGSRTAHPVIGPPAEQLDDPSARPQAGTVPRRFQSRNHQARKPLPLLDVSFGGRPDALGGHAASRGPVADASASSDGWSADRPQALRHDMNRNVTLKQFDRAKSSPLELSRTPLWAHAAPPTGEHSRVGH